MSALLEQQQQQPTAPPPSNNEDWLTVTRHICDSLDKPSWIRRLVAQGSRLDGRLASSARPTVVATNVLPKHSLGSAMVTLGGGIGDGNDNSNNKTTSVLAGVTGCIGQPTTSPGGTVSVVLSSTNSNNQSTMNSNNHTTAMSNTKASLQSWLERMVAPTIDPLSLVIEGAFMNQQIQAWGLTVTVVVLQEDGSVDDAALLAAMTALQHTVLPAVTFGTDGRVMTLEEYTSTSTGNGTVLPPRSLTLQSWPIPLTVGRVEPAVSFHPEEEEEDTDDGDTGSHKSTDNNKKNDVWLVDPAKDEEMACQARLTVVVNGKNSSDNNNDNDVMSVEHRGGGLPLSTLALVAHMARGRAKELMPLLTAAGGGGGEQKGARSS